MIKILEVKHYVDWHDRLDGFIVRALTNIAWYADKINLHSVYYKCGYKADELKKTLVHKYFRCVNPTYVCCNLKCMYWFEIEKE